MLAALPISFYFDNTPLWDAMEGLAKLSNLPKAAFADLFQEIATRTHISDIAEIWDPSATRKPIALGAITVNDALEKLPALYSFGVPGAGSYGCTWNERIGGILVFHIVPAKP